VHFSTNLNAYICEVVLGQENLGYRLVELAEKVIIQTHQATLTDSCDSLMDGIDMRTSRSISQRQVAA
jgi:hypothetical protein